MGGAGIVSIYIIKTKGLRARDTASNSRCQEL
jgi:hypothetical protein